MIYLFIHFHLHFTKHVWKKSLLKLVGNWCPINYFMLFQYDFCYPVDDISTLNNYSGRFKLCF